MTGFPPSVELDWTAAHRLIPARFSEAGTVLAEISDGDAMTEDLILLDGATNDRIQGEEHGLVGISTYELVYGIPNASIINAAFTHAHPEGSRFNDATRGAWYAAEEIETSIAEVVYHRARRLGEIVVPELPTNRPDRETTTYNDWLSDFRTAFHSLEPSGSSASGAPPKYSQYLAPEPVPACYREPQRLAHELLAAKSNGILYPSVRRRGGNCLACFRPALVYKPRQGESLEIELILDGNDYRPTIRPAAF